jgi:hypothetical protein
MVRLHSGSCCRPYTPPLSHGAPSVPISPHTGQFVLQSLDLCVQLAGVHGQLHALILRLGQLLPKLGVFRGESEDKAGRFMAHTAKS